MMDRRLHTGTVNAYFVSMFDMRLLCMHKEEAVYLCERRRIDPLDVALQRRFARNLTGPQATKFPRGKRISQMIGELIVRIAADLFDDERSQNLFGAQPRPAFGRIAPTHQISLNQLVYLRIGVQDLTDLPIFMRALVVAKLTDGYRELLYGRRSHRGLLAYEILLDNYIFVKLSRKVVFRIFSSRCADNFS